MLSRTNLSIRSKLLLLAGVFALGFLIFGAFSYSTLKLAKVHGPYYRQIVMNKDLLADVLPPPNYQIEDVDIEDPMLRTMFHLDHVPQITNIQFWRRNGGYTSERGADSEEVHLRAIRDAKRRIMVLMTHNTDIADSWEREGEDPGFFFQFSPAGYALGIDVLLHVMTH